MSLQVWLAHRDVIKRFAHRSQILWHETPSESRSTKEGSSKCSQPSVPAIVLLSRYRTFQSFRHLLSPSSLSLSSTYFYLSSVLTLRLNIVDREEPSKKLIIGARSWDQKKIRIRANRRGHSRSLFPPLRFQRAEASPWPCMLCAGLCWVPSVMTLFSPVRPQALSMGFSRQEWTAVPFSSPGTISSHKLPSPFRGDLTLWIILYVGPSNTEWGNVFEENFKM